MVATSGHGDWEIQQGLERTLVRPRTGNYSQSALDPRIIVAAEELTAPIERERNWKEFSPWLASGKYLRVRG